MSLQSSYTGSFNLLYDNAAKSQKIMDTLANLSSMKLRIDEEIARLHENLRVIDGMDHARFHRSTECSGNHFNTVICDIPDDILSEIFLQCLPGEGSNATMSIDEAPFLLGRICRRWRDVAYNLTPMLWSTLHITIPCPPSESTRINSWDPAASFRELYARFEQRFQQHQDAVNSWLARSGDVPLSISLHPQKGARLLDSHHQAAARTYLSILQKYSHRWYDVNITVLPGPASTALASMHSEDLPLLTRLHISFTKGARHELNWQTSGLWGGSGLRALRICHMPYSVSSIGVDWSRLSTLAVTESGTYRSPGLSIHEAYHVLKACHNLIHCDIDIIESQPADANTSLPEAIITLPFLESIAIIDGCRSSSALTELLYTPSLRTLSYHTSMWHSPSRRSPLIPLLSKIGAQLESVITDVRWCFTLMDLHTFFQLAPNVTYFTNNSRIKPSLAQLNGRGHMPPGFNLMQAFLNLLTPSNRAGQLYLPRLQVLKLHDGTNVSETRIFEFVEARMSHASSDIKPLAALHVDFLRERDVDIRPHLIKYIENGLNLTLNYPIPKLYPAGTFALSERFSSLQGRDDIPSWRDNIAL